MSFTSKIMASFVLASFLIVGCRQTGPVPVTAVTPTDPTKLPDPATATLVLPTATLLPPTVVPSPTAVAAPDFSSSGAIVFASDIEGDTEIYLMPVPDESESTIDEWLRLTDNHHSDFGPAWSPDGRQIAFISERGGSPNIYVLNVAEVLQNAAGSAPQRLTNTVATDVAWSADGTQIAFASEQDGDVEIFVINVDGTNERQLTDNDTEDVNPAWSPDNEKILFASRRDGRYQEIYVMNSDGSSQQRLTDNDANDYAPAWSPDGTQIAFTFDVAGDPEIFVMNADGSDRQQITDHPNAMDWWPSWSPDGRQIVFCALDQANFENLHDIYVVNADGSNMRQLTNDTADTWWPDWGP